MRDSVLLYVNGNRHDVAGDRAFATLSDFLRYDLGLTGTKVVCAEGDCGSCSILLGRPNSDATALEYRAICSCIQFVYQLDGAHVVTVEGLKYDGQLNPLQESMVRCHAAQCGFCTPGFVVAMQAMHESTPNPAAASATEVRKAVVGNLCRCTGYDSIVRAGVETPWNEMRRINDLYPPQPILESIAESRTEDLQVASGLAAAPTRRRSAPAQVTARTWRLNDDTAPSDEPKLVYKPTAIERAVAFRAEHPSCTIINGGTDIGVQVNKGIREPREILSLGAIASLRELHVEHDRIIAGASVTIAQLEAVCRERLPEYADLLYWFGSPPIKAAATIGGNIANGSPIGDSMPALFVLDAEVELTGVTGARRVNINDFYTGYRATVGKPDELITAVTIPLPNENETLKLYKLSRRKDLDISAFTGAFLIRMDGPRIAAARIAFGGVGPTIVRLREVEQFLSGKTITASTFEHAGRIAREQVKPITDVRGSADYRSQLAENILKKLFTDLTGTLGQAIHVNNGRFNGNGRVH